MKSFNHFYSVIRLQDIKRINESEVVWNAMAPDCMKPEMVQFLGKRKATQAIKECFERFTNEGALAFNDTGGDTIQWKTIK